MDLVDKIIIVIAAIFILWLICDQLVKAQHKRDRAQEFGIDGLPDFGDSTLHVYKLGYLEGTEAASSVPARFENCQAVEGSPPVTVTWADSPAGVEALNRMRRTSLGETDAEARARLESLYDASLRPGL